MKFCGMCGSPLQAGLADERGAASSEKAPARRPDPIERDSVERDPVESSPIPGGPIQTEPSSVEPVLPRETFAAPAYTGGTFRLMGQEVDPGTRNLDYLLEDDDDEGSSRGPWLLVFLIALALAGGLGYWHYRNGGWTLGKTSTTATPDKPTAASSSDNTVSAPATAADQSANQGAATAAAPQAPTTAALSDVRPRRPPAVPVPAPEAPPGNETASATAATKPAAHAASKPAAAKAEVPVKAEDPVTLGEKYIYGRGVPQNCDRGLKTVRPAADAFNGKAMITMGALYATGHCVARDLPTAYRYFALALRKDPDNPALKQNAEMVWGQMTQSERQQAIRLTQ